MSACPWWCPGKHHTCPTLRCPVQISPSLQPKAPIFSPTKPSCPVSSSLRASSHYCECPTGPGGPGDRGRQLRVRAVSPQRGGEVVQGEGLPQSPPAVPGRVLLPALPYHPLPSVPGPQAGEGGQSSGVLPACTPEGALPGQDGQELRPGPHCRIYSAGRRRVLQLSRCELADAGIYTCDAGDCRASATLHVQGTATHLPGGTRTPKLRAPPQPPWHPVPHPQSARSASSRTCRTPRCGRVTMPSSPARRHTGT